MKRLKFSCPCHFGLESVLKFEATKIGGEDISVSDGKVTFYGDFSTLAKANICISTAERILIVLGEFHAETFDELFNGVKKIPFEDFIGKHDAFPVKSGHALNSALHSIPDCQSIIKKAAVERLKSKYGISWFEETGATFPIQFSIIKDEAVIYLDTSGEGLHKRGYRRNSNAAPIKETLAAGIVDLARIRGDSVVCDPFCGSGTILIESAYKALNTAPGLRRKFLAEKWGCIPSSVWSDARGAAIEAIRHDTAFRATGYDIDSECVALTKDNAAKAGVVKRISTSVADVKNYKNENGTITICNPPYGERLLEIKQAEELYKVMGTVFKANKDAPCYIISPHEEFEKFFGKKADKRRKLYNGMIKCQLFMYYK
ncbi:MAG: class I SAM-dependent RNA methyltransferase [Ruminococcus sp.]|nr:class I SAM-dependent RNA methyltransferase [Ruminococcus sp.]